MCKPCRFCLLFCFFAHTCQKPDKIYLGNTNLAYALKGKPDIGNIRETFVFNQLINAGLEVNLPKKGDFIINDYTAEVGGKGV
jgi:hypothetical protein